MSGSYYTEKASLCTVKVERALFNGPLNEKSRSYNLMRLIAMMYGAAYSQYSANKLIYFE